MSTMMMWSAKKRVDNEYARLAFRRTAVAKISRDAVRKTNAEEEEEGISFPTFLRRARAEEELLVFCDALRTAIAREEIGERGEPWFDDAERACTCSSSSLF